MIGCERQSELRQTALDCAILNHNTVLGLVVSLDKLDDPQGEAVYGVVGGEVVETLAVDVAHLEDG